MIPIRHTLPSRTRPVVTHALVIANVLLFIGMLFLGEQAEMLINTFGYIPARLLNPAAFGYSHSASVAILIACTRLRAFSFVTTAAR